MPDTLFNLTKEEALERIYNIYLNSDDYGESEEAHKKIDEIYEVIEKIDDKTQHKSLDDLIGHIAILSDKDGFKRGLMYAVSLSKLLDIG